MDLKTIGLKIASMRKGRGYTQKELAKMVDVAPSSISMYENGNREASLETYAAIAKIFGVPITAFTEDFSELEQKIENSTPEDWDALYPTGTALRRTGDSSKRSVELTDSDLVTLAKYLRLQTDETPMTPEARIVSFGMDQLPQQDRETILNMIRAMFSKRPEAKLFADKEENDNDT